MIETELQNDYVMDFLCRRADGLKYREVKNTTVNNDLFIPADLKEFVSGQSPVAWRNLKQKHGGDEQEVIRLLMDELKRRLMEATNVALFLNKNRSITLEGEQLQIIYVSGTELSGDEEFEKNIFSAVQEMSYRYDHNGAKQYAIRPDVSFFVNGIFLGYMELKSVSNGQNARKHGRDKITTDYLEAMQAYARLADGNDVKQSLRRNMLRIFEKSIHLVSTDINETYVLRNVAQFFDETKKGFYDGTLTISDYRPNINKVFKPYPLSDESMPQEARFEEVMTALYSKKMIEKEILYYNFLQYTYQEKADGKKKAKKERTSNTGRLISPRPKQKYGCDKIMRRVREMLDHEQEPDYFINKLRNDLTQMGASAEKIEKIIADRQAYCNNKYVYSLLLQYAAGFGKSNIIGWTALQLKDMRYNGEWAYDKVLIVVDRLQLRDQTDTMMMNMNIDKAMFTEARDQKEFIRALTDKRRIIVVNIQKFLDLQDALKHSGKQLKHMRVAFLIDEIHRSNTGDSHEQMVSTFDQLQDVFDANEGSVLGRKKNLIVGFTATPSEKVLARFGEYYGGENINQLWIPFDCYTMSEAIKDGYILDPTKHIIPIPTKMHFELPEVLDGLTMDEAEKLKVSLAVKKIYENKERMKELSKFIVNRLVSLVYGKIHGQGKTMLAVTSIPIAIDYCKIIRQLMAQKCQSKRYEKYKDAPIAIVYSDNQNYESCSSMNGNMSEEKVIQNFKQAKNGLIIVVDKLQTGFDEPKLHTLFLDKEIREINAIQTISRVNRTCRYKEECHIVDMTYGSANVGNIRGAFKMFCDMVVSDFDPKEERRVMMEMYDLLRSEYLFVRWFEKFKEALSLPNNTMTMMAIDSDMRQWIKAAVKRAEEQMQNENEDGNEEENIRIDDDAKTLRKLIGKYNGELLMLDGVMDVEAKYKDEAFGRFWQRYCEMYRSETMTDSTIANIDAEYDGEWGFVTAGLDLPSEDGTTDEDNEDDGGEDNDNENENEKKKPGKKSQKKVIDFAELVEALNEEEEITAEEIAMWKSSKQKFYDQMSADAEFVAMIKDDNFEREQVEKAYHKQLRKFKRGMERMGIPQPRLFGQMLDENAEQIFDDFCETINPTPEMTIEMPSYEAFDDDAYAMAAEDSGRTVDFNPSDSLSGSMKALAIRQPWASLIACGVKDVECRDTMVPPCKRFLIAASGTKERLEYLPPFVLDAVNGLVEKGVMPPYEYWPTKAIVGYVDIDRVTYDDVDSIWAEGHQGIKYVLGNAHVLEEPIYGRNKATPLFYNVDGYDDEHLPAAHKVMSE